MMSAPLPAGQPPTALSVLAAVIASRSEQAVGVAPLSSAVVVTGMVAAQAGASNRIQASAADASASKNGRTTLSIGTPHAQMPRTTRRQHSANASRQQAGWQRGQRCCQANIA